jgi:Flp pilus assembly protein TadD
MPPSFRICPACESRNKAGWEFCVRCGESLQNVPLGDRGAAGRGAAAATVDESTSAGPGAGSVLTTVLALAALVGAVLFVFRGGPVLETSRPDPSLFTLPTVAPSLPPPPSAVPDAPGMRAYAQGRRLFAQGDAAGAIPLLAQAVSEDSSNAEFHNVYGKALLAGGGVVEEGLRQLQEAVNLAPRNPEYGSSLGRAYEQAKREKDAITAYEAVLATQPDFSQTLEDLGRLHLRAGRNDKAAPILRHAAELRPGDLPLQQDLAIALQKSGDNQGAAAVYRKIIETIPQADTARGLLAEALLADGRKDEAVATFREGLDHNPNSPLLHRGLGSALERAGRVEEAIKEYREYARLQPDNADAKSLAERANRLEKKLADAKETP